MGHSVEMVALSPAPLPVRLMNTMRSAISGEPLQIGYSHSSATERDLDSRAKDFDLIVPVHARAAALIPPAIRSRSFAFIIDAYGQNYATYAPALPPVERDVYRLEARRMQDFEVKLAREFAGVGVVSEYDRKFLVTHGADPNKVFALPGGADVEHFVNTARAPDPARPLFVFIGRLNYLPNREAVGRLIKEIWPAARAAVPQARLRVIGAQLDYLASRYRVQPLDDVVAWLADGAEGPPRVAAVMALAPVDARRPARDAGRDRPAGSDATGRRNPEQDPGGDGGQAARRLQQLRQPGHRRDPGRAPLGRRNSTGLRKRGGPASNPP